MAVVESTEILSTGGDFTGVHEKLSRMWLIKVNSTTDNEKTIATELAGSVLPVLFESHPNNIFATARSLSVTRKKGLLWVAKSEYSTQPLAQQEKDKQEEKTPTDRRVHVSWQAVGYDKVIVKDIKGKAVVNSGGDYYDPPPSVQWERLDFRFQKNYSAAPLWMLSFCNSVNKKKISILGITIPAGMAKFSQPSGSIEQEENGKFYHTTEWGIECDVQTWQLELLDEGLREKNGAGDQVEITDANGTAVSSPVLLDGSGSQLASPTLDNAVFNTHEVYTKKDYTLLPGISAG